LIVWSQSTPFFFLTLREATRTKFKFSLARVSSKSDFYDMILKFKSLGLDFELENKKIVFVKENANERLRIDDLTPHLARLFEHLLLNFINNHKKENQPKKKRSLQNELSKNSKIKDQEKLGYEL